jgi:hypothetical protein
MTKISRILNELHVGELTFGFEFEAYYKSKSETSINNKEWLLDYWGSIGKSELGTDASLKTTRNQISFEMKSPPIPATTPNLIKLESFLNEARDKGFYTTKNCGFHIHIGREDLNSFDFESRLKIVMNFKRCYKTLTEINQFKFSNTKHASLENITTLVPLFKKNEGPEELQSIVRKVINLISMKNNVIHFHYQRTIEWRGPRNFLNAGLKEDVHNFILHLRKFLYYVSKATSGDRSLMFGAYTNREVEDALASIKDKESGFDKPDPFSKAISIYKNDFNLDSKLLGSMATIIKRNIKPLSTKILNYLDRGKDTLDYPITDVFFDDSVIFKLDDEFHALLEPTTYPPSTKNFMNAVIYTNKYGVITQLTKQALDLLKRKLSYFLETIKDNWESNKSRIEEDLITFKDSMYTFAGFFNTTRNLIGKYFENSSEVLKTLDEASEVFADSLTQLQEFLQKNDLKYQTVVSYLRGRF